MYSLKELSVQMIGDDDKSTWLMVYSGLLLIEIGTIRVDVVGGDGVCTLLLLCCVGVGLVWFA